MFLLLKLLHVMAVIAFLGNISTGLFWHAQAARSRDPRLLAQVMRGIISSDRWFTVPGVIGIIASGVAMAIIAGYPILGTDWIWSTLILFTVSGLIFMARVAPLQRQLCAVAEQAVPSASLDYASYRKLARRWELWGALSLAAPVAGLALMVFKPDFS